MPVPSMHLVPCGPVLTFRGTQAAARCMLKSLGTLRKQRRQVHQQSMSYTTSERPHSSSHGAAAAEQHLSAQPFKSPRSTMGSARQRQTTGRQLSSTNQPQPLQQQQQQQQQNKHIQQNQRASSQPAAAAGTAPTAGSQNQQQMGTVRNLFGPQQEASRAAAIHSTGSQAKSSATSFFQQDTPRRQWQASSHAATYAKLVAELKAASRQGAHARNQQGQVGHEAADMLQLCMMLESTLRDGSGLKPATLAAHAAAISRMQQQTHDKQLQQALSNTQQALFEYLLKAGLHDYNLVQLSILRQAMARMRVAGPQAQQLLAASMQQLAQLGVAPWLDKQSEAWSPVTVSMTVWSFAAAGYEGDVKPLVTAVNAAVRAGIMDSATPQAWTNTLWGAAQLGVLAADMQHVWDLGWAHLASQVSQQRAQHSTEHSAQHGTQQRTLDPTATAVGSGNVMIPQNISNTLWAAAKAGYQPSGGSTADVLAAAIDNGIMSNAKLQEWSNTLWAVAKLDVPASSSKMRRVWEAGISSVAAAFAMHKAYAVPSPASARPANMKSRVLRQYQLGPADMQAASNVIWAAASSPSWADPSGQLSAQLADIIAACCESRLVDTANEQAWANLLWAAGKLNIQLPESSHVAVSTTLKSAVAAGRLQHGTPAAWACILWGATQLGIYADAILPVWQAAGPRVAAAIKGGHCTPQAAMMVFDAAADCQCVPVYGNWLKSLTKAEGGRQLLRAADVGQLCGILRAISGMYGSTSHQHHKRLAVEAAAACIHLLAQQVGDMQLQTQHHTVASAELAACIPAMSSLGMFHPNLMSVVLQQQLALQDQHQEGVRQQITSRARSTKQTAVSRERVQSSTSSSNLTVALLTAAAKTLAGIHYSQQLLMPHTDLVVSFIAAKPVSGGQSSPSRNRARSKATGTAAGPALADDVVLSAQVVEGLLQDAHRLMSTLTSAKFRECSTHCLANLLWAWAVLLPHAEAAGKQVQQQCKQVAAAAFVECEYRGPEAFNELELNQVFTAHLEAVEIGLDASAAGLAGDSPLLRAARATWRKLSSDVLTSKAQQEVCHCLTQLGYHAVLERSTPNNNDGQERMTVDIMVTRTPEGKACAIAVEFDGPTHFLLQPANAYDGSSALRHRQLKRRVPALLLISYSAWNDLGTGSAAPVRKLEYLQQQMRAVCDSSIAAV